MTEFSEKCMSLATDVYCTVSSLNSIIQEETLKHIIQVRLDDYLSLCNSYSKTSDIAC